MISGFCTNRSGCSLPEVRKKDQINRYALALMTISSLITIALSAYASYVRDLQYTTAVAVIGMFVYVGWKYMSQMLG